MHSISVKQKMSAVCYMQPMGPNFSSFTHQEEPLSYYFIKSIISLIKFEHTRFSEDYTLF